MMSVEFESHKLHYLDYEEQILKIVGPIYWCGWSTFVLNNQHN